MKKSVLITILTFALANIALAQQTFPRQVSMMGSASLKGIPTTAQVTAGTSNQAKTAKEALEANNKAMHRVIDGLKAIGVDAKDIASSQISLRPVVEYNNRNVPRVVSYDAAHMLTIRFKEIALIGEGLDKIVSAGANTIGEVELLVPDSKEKRDEARVNAIKEARRKAELLVTTAGGKLGRLIGVQEVGGGGIRPQPRMAKSAMTMAADSSVPVAAGEQSEEVQVNVTWEIVD